MPPKGQTHQQKKFPRISKNKKVIKEGHKR